MGNHRFRLSDIMPYSWFCKLKDKSSRTRNQNPTPPTKKKHHPTSYIPAPPHPTQPHHLSHQRKSHYFTRDLTPPPNPNPSATHFPDPPRKSSKNRRTTKRNSLVATSGRTCRATVNPERYPNSPSPTNLSNNDVVFHMANNNSPDAKFENGFDPFSETDLPPITTKPSKSSPKMEEIINTSARRFSVKSPRVKLRTNSPRISIRKVQCQGRKSVSSSGSRRSVAESYAVVKSSEDPQRDFMESMVEMIMENNIRAAKDLEELLACYLSLNSYQYHDLIIKVFKKIWFDINDI